MAISTSPIPFSPNSYTPGDPIIASEVEDNFSVVNTWLLGKNITQAMLAEFTDVVEWSIAGADQAISIVSTSTDSAIDIAYSGTQLSASEALIKIVDSSAHDPGDPGAGDIWIQRTSASNAIPGFRIDNAGSGSAIQVNGTGTGNLLQLQDTAVDKFVVDSGGDLVGQDISAKDISGETLTLDDTGTADLIIAKQASTEVFKVEDDGASLALSLQLGPTGGTNPILSKNADSCFLLQNTLRFYDTSGPLLSRSANSRLNIANEFQINSGPILSNSSGSLAVNAPITCSTNDLTCGDITSDTIVTRSGKGITVTDANIAAVQVQGSSVKVDTVVLDTQNSKVMADNSPIMVAGDQVTNAFPRIVGCYIRGNALYQVDAIDSFGTPAFRNLGHPATGVYTLQVFQNNATVKPKLAVTALGEWAGGSQQIRAWATIAEEPVFAGAGWWDFNIYTSIPQGLSPYTQGVDIDVCIIAYTVNDS